MAQPFGPDNTAYKHGFAARGKRPAIYWRWRHMVARCHQPSDKDYGNYGARGITVGDRWRKGEEGVSGFVCWLQDMGPMPAERMSVERRDNSKGYSPDNCYWASNGTQSNNRRSNRLVTAMGQTLTVAQWARIVGIGPKTIRYRLEQGATALEALTKRPNHGVRLSTGK